MSNSYYIALKNRTNAQTAVNNNSRMVAAIQDSINTALTNPDGALNLTNPNFQGLTTAYDFVTQNTAVFQKTAEFKGDVTFGGTVRGTKFEGTVDSGEYTIDKNSILSSIATNNAVATAGLADHGRRLNLVEPRVNDIDVRLASVSTKVGDETFGLVKKVADNTTNITSLTQLNAGTRLTDLETSVNGTSGGTVGGLTRNVTNLRTRMAQVS